MRTTGSRTTKDVRLPIRIDDWQRLEAEARRRRTSITRLVLGWIEPELEPLRTDGQGRSDASE